jgi:hypothetical protein
MVTGWQTHHVFLYLGVFKLFDPTAKSARAAMQQ